MSDTKQIVSIGCATVDYINKQLKKIEDYYLTSEGVVVFDYFIFLFGSKLCKQYPQMTANCLSALFWNNYLLENSERACNDPYEELIALWHKYSSQNKEDVGKQLYEIIYNDNPDAGADLILYVKENADL